MVSCLSAAAYTLTGIRTSIEVDTRTRTPIVIVEFYTASRRIAKLEIVGIPRRRVSNAVGQVGEGFLAVRPTAAWPRGILTWARTDASSFWAPAMVDERAVQLLGLYYVIIWNGYQTIRVSLCSVWPGLWE